MPLHGVPVCVVVRGAAMGGGGCRRWNPAAEDQAIDRVHRLGQTRAVRVVRFVTRDTADEKIVLLQVCGAARALLVCCVAEAHTHSKQHLFAAGAPAAVSLSRFCFALGPLQERKRLLASGVMGALPKSEVAKIRLEQLRLLLDD
jgi:hypothetical protein